MMRLSLVFGLFLAVTVGGVVSILSLLAKVSFATLLFRSLTTFFGFGILGVILGFALEVLVMPVAAIQEGERVRREISLEDPTIEEELGDLLDDLESAPLHPTDGGVLAGAVPPFQPAEFPQMTVRAGKVVARGESAVAAG